MAHLDHNQDLVFQEVDEQLAQDRLHKLWENYKIWIIGSFIGLFAGLAIFVGVRDYYRAQDQDASDRYIQALEALDKDQPKVAAEALKGLQTKHGEHGYGLLSHLSEAQMLAKQGDFDGAVASLDRLITLAKAGQPAMADLARINAAYLLSKQPQRAMVYLDAMRDPSAYSAHAYELRGVLAQAAGDNKLALSHYQKAMQFNPPNTLSQRLMEHMVRMGGMDAVRKAQLVEPAKAE